jgi:hypothetical protein
MGTKQMEQIVGLNLSSYRYEFLLILAANLSLCEVKPRIKIEKVLIGEIDVL